jgi:alkaline phosphatase D
MIFLLVIFSQCHEIIQPDEYYCNIFAGEPTQTSVILLGRLQKSDTLVNKDLKGIEGYIKFRITRDSNSKYFMESPFYRASEFNDFIAKYEFTGLRPGQKYYYSISYGRDTSNYTSSPWNSFKTLNLPTSDKNISFIVCSGLNGQGIINEDSLGNVSPFTATVMNSKNSAFKSISYWKPDFLIVNGNNYNINVSQDSPIATKEDFRIQWHGLFSLPEFTKILSKTPSFWIHPDDSDAGKFYAELVPIPAGISEEQSSRTYRLNRDVQLWILGSQCFIVNPADKNKPWNNQLNWLKTTLKESDSPFKLIISPVGFISPFDIADTQSNQEYSGFMIVRDSLINWLKNNGFRNNGLFFICCKTPWQYHSIDPTGFEEFSCGAIVNGNSFMGSIPNDSLSANNVDQIIKPFTQTDSSGGFLLINSDRDEFNSPVLLFRFFDEQKKLLYAVNKF